MGPFGALRLLRATRRVVNFFISYFLASVMPAAGHEQAGAERKRIEWLPGLDSNQNWVSQSHLCYHYTTRQWRESA